MRLLTLDLSIMSAGFADWSDDQPRPRTGTIRLAPGLDYGEKAFVRLRHWLIDMHNVSPFERGDEIVYEQPLDPGTMNRPNNPRLPYILMGLAATVDCFCEEVGVRYFCTHQATWRRHFIGTMKRGTKKVDLKRLTMERCRQLGLSPQKDDEGDAIGVMDHRLSQLGVIPPWRAANLLVPTLEAARR